MGSYALYRQCNGEFLILEVDDGGQERVVYDARGYAGRHDGRNRAELEDVRNVGPLPRGRYSVEVAEHRRFRPPAFRLSPFPQNLMHGRSGFWIHGDSMVSPGNASSGCIVLDRPAREAVAYYEVSTLEVVPI